MKPHHLHWIQLHAHLPQLLVRHSQLLFNYYQSTTTAKSSTLNNPQPQHQQYLQLSQQPLFLLAIPRNYIILTKLLLLRAF